MLKCWSGLKVPSTEKACLSCYLDAARNLARVPIRNINDYINRFEDEEARVNERIKNAINGKEVPDINQTLVRAVLVVSTGFDIIEEIEKDMNQLILKEAELLDEDIKNENSEPAEYRGTLIFLASIEYLKDRKISYDAGSRVLKATKELEKFLDKNITADEDF